MGGYFSKRQDMCQCPECGFVSRPFAASADARAIEIAPLDAFGWGRCRRCGASKLFTSVIEQCHRCGRLLEGRSTHALELADDREAVNRLFDDDRPDSAAGSARKHGLWRWLKLR